MVLFNTAECNEAHLHSRAMALDWLCRCLDLPVTQRILLHTSGHMSTTIRVALHGLADMNGSIREDAQRLNSVLFRHAASIDAHVVIADQPLVDTLTQRIAQGGMTRVAALRWLAKLMQRNIDDRAICAAWPQLHPALIKSLADVSDDVVRKATEVIGRFARGYDDEDGSTSNASASLLRTVLSQMMQAFRQKARLLTQRSTLIVPGLCAWIGAECVYLEIAEWLLVEPDDAFAKKVLRILNLILLTAAETRDLRTRLRASHNEPLADPASIEIFERLFVCWSRNSVAALSLSLFSNSDELALAIVYEIAAQPVTMAIYEQLLQLADMIDSPIFLRTLI
jgi:hypothetical protein